MNKSDTTTKEYLLAEIDDLADELWHKDKAFFYSKFLVNEIK